MPPSKAKGGKSAKAGKTKGGLQLPKVMGDEKSAADVEASKGRSYYAGPTPPASIYRMRLKQLFIKMNKSDDYRFTWIADIDEEGPRSKYNGYGIVNGENYSEAGMPYVNAMIDALGLDRKQFHDGGIKVDDPRADISDKVTKQIVEAVGKQSVTEDAGIYFYIATLKKRAYGSTDPEETALEHQQYMSEEQWEAAVAGAAGDVNDEDDEDDDEDDTEEVEVESDDEEEESDDDEDDDEEDDEEDEDDDDEDDEEDDDDEEEEDDEPDLSALSPGDLKQRIVDDKRFKDVKDIKALKGVKKPALIEMLQNGPAKPEKTATKGKAKKGGKAPF